MAITKKQLQDQVAALQKQLAALEGEKEELSQKEPEPMMIGDLRVYTSAFGMEAMELFQTAMEQNAFVTYRAVGEALGIVAPGEKWKGFGPDSHTAEVMSFVEEAEIDHLVVNRQGKYGKKAPVEKHHAALKSLGYKQFPSHAPKKGKGKKMEKAEMIAMMLKLLAD